jgi:beta-glucanase (GH16 family)
MEWVQKYGPGTTSSTIHGPGYSGAHGIGSQFPFPANGRIDDGQFHTYGMTWSENRMEFYRDDPTKPYFVVTPANLPPGQTWVYNHPFFVILNFAVGEAGFPGTVDATTPHAGSMWVDYVRFYQQQ